MEEDGGTYRILERTTPLTRAKCPPAMKKVAGWKKCKPFENPKKRLRFKKFLVRSQALNTLESLAFNYVKAEAIMEKPANGPYTFAVYMAEKTGKGGKEYVDRYIQTLKTDVKDLHRRLRHFETNFEEILEERLVALEAKIDNIPDLQEFAAYKPIQRPQAQGHHHKHIKISSNSI